MKKRWGGVTTYWLEEKDKKPDGLTVLDIDLSKLIRLLEATEADTIDKVLRDVVHSECERG